MKKKSRKLAMVAVIATVSVSIGFVALVVHNYKTKTSFKFSSDANKELESDQNAQDGISTAVNNDAAALSETRKNSDILKISSTDFVVGDNAAPITVIEYASLSCPHCAAFYRESYEKLKTEYVDTGKVKFVFRHFPLNQPALAAAMFATCQAKDNPDKYYGTLKALFKTQDSWAFDQKYDEKLEIIAKLDGMSSERFKTCISDQSLQEKILVTRLDASKNLQIKSVPTFFVNGEASEGYVDYLTIKKLIDKKLAEPEKK